MSRQKYLWRVTATYSKRYGTVEAPQIHTWTTSRCYQSLRGAEHRAAVWREGRLAEGLGPNGDWGRSGIEKADRVVIERSAPIDGWAEVPS